MAFTRASISCIGALVFSLGCGSAATVSALDDDSRGSGGSPGAIDAHSTRGDAGNVATGEARVSGGAATPCPDTVPLHPDSCRPEGQTCFYEDCSGAGRSVVTCENGVWHVNVGACEEVQCAYPSTTTCPPGQLCAVTAGDTLSARCIENTCGKGPITCECAGSCDTCSVGGNMGRGISLSCQP